MLTVKPLIFVTLSGNSIWYNNPTKYKAISNCYYVFWREWPSSVQVKMKIIHFSLFRKKEIKPDAES